MMSLRPRNVDFQETWAKLKETVSGVVRLQRVERGVWNVRFSDVYALCVAQPDPLADRLYDETRSFLEEHVSSLLVKVRGDAELHSADFQDGLLERYVDTWRQYSEGARYLNCLYSYLNLQHVRRHKISDADMMYGSAATVACPDHDSRQLEIGELALVTWERCLVRPLAAGLTARLVAGLSAARGGLEARAADVLRCAVASTVEVGGSLALYDATVLQPYLAAAQAHHAAAAARALADDDVSTYMQHALQGLERECALAGRFLHASSLGAVRACYERAAVAAHLPALHAHADRLLRDPQRRMDLRRMYLLLRPLPGDALRPLVEAARLQATRDGHALLDQPHRPDMAHIHFVNSMLTLHERYTKLFNEVFDGAQPFMGALDKACSAVVNSGVCGEGGARAPDLLARYCDAVLRRRAATDDHLDDKLSAAIVVFKYVDDKDVFQKYYARALARRLIHQLSASMEQEEAMINRLKAACGYEFTNKLHRMYTDVCVSGDLNERFQHHLRDTGQTSDAGFFVQVLQAGAWPLAGGGAVAVPAGVERGARAFEAWYRGAFSGRRLAWLHALSAGELRALYPPRRVLLAAPAPMLALLLHFDACDELPAADLRHAAQLPRDAWRRHLRPLLDAGLLIAHGDVMLDDNDGDEEPEGEGGTISLNLEFSCKRTKIRLTCANLPQHQGGSSLGGAEEAAHCEDDRKMYLQAALVRIMKQRKVLRHSELIQEVVAMARGSFAPSVAMIKKCIEALIDKQYLERAPGTLDTYSYLA